MKTIEKNKERRQEWLKRLIKEVANTRWQEEQKFLGNKEVSIESIPLQYIIDFKYVLYDYLFWLGEKQEGKLDVLNDLPAIFEDLAPALEYAIANAGAINDGLEPDISL